jgi:hypothetical protein
VEQSVRVEVRFDWTSMQIVFEYGQSSILDNTMQPDNVEITRFH